VTSSPDTAPGQAAGPSDASAEGGGGTPGTSSSAWRRHGRRWAVLAILVLVVSAGVVGVRLLGGTDPDRDSGPGPGPGPDRAPEAGPAAPDGWVQAWESGDAETLREWFRANTGPTRSIEGTVEGGEIRSQEDADRLVGHVVTSRLTVACDCTLEEFVLLDADLRVDDGNVTIRNVRLDGQDNDDIVGAITLRGSTDVTVSHVEIAGHHDGIRAYADDMSVEYVYIHDVSDQNPEDFHQDGIQVAGGEMAIERSFIDRVGANTSALLVKSDSAPIGTVTVHDTVLMGGGYTLSIQGGPEGDPGWVDLSGNLVAPGYRRGLVSIWEIDDPEGVVASAQLTVSGTGEKVDVVDGAQL
jgi:hypothetical protein